MSQSLTNQNTNSQSMNGLITVNANTITTSSIQTDVIDITNSGTLDIIPTTSTSTTDTRLINAGWVNNRLLSFGGNYVDLTTNQTIGGTKTFSNTIVGSINGNAGSATQVYNTLVAGTDTTTYNVAFGTNLGANGNINLYQTSGLTYKPSTNLLSCLSSSTNTLSSVNTTTTNSGYYLPFILNSGSNQPINVDGSTTNTLKYNPNAQQLTCANVTGANVAMTGNITANTTIVSDDFTARTITGSNNLFNTTTTGAVKIATNLSGAGSIVIGNATTQANNTFYGASTLPPSTTNIIGGLNTVGSYFPLSVSNLNASGGYTPYTSVNFSYNGLGQVRMSDLLLNGSFFVSNPSLNSYNLRLGDSTCMANATTGSFYNMAFGVGASNALTTATDNIGLGNYTLALNQTGFCNVAIGNGALNNITTTGGNVALGYQSNTSNSSASNTIAIGIFSSATLDDAIAIGSNASASYANSVAIGLNATATADNQIQLGTSTNTVNCSSLNSPAINSSIMTTTFINSNQASNLLSTTAGLNINSNLMPNTSAFAVTPTTAPLSTIISADGTKQYFISGQNVYSASILQQQSSSIGITYQAQSTTLTLVSQKAGALCCSYDGRIVLIGRTNGSIGVSLDWGYSFTSIAVSTATTYITVAMNSTGTSMISISQVGVVYYSNNYGTTWTAGSGTVATYPIVCSAGYIGATATAIEYYVMVGAGGATPVATSIYLIAHTVGSSTSLTQLTNAGSRIWNWISFLNSTSIATSSAGGVWTTNSTTSNTGWSNPITTTGYIGATIHTSNPNVLYYLLNGTSLQTWNGVSSTVTGVTVTGVTPTFLGGGDRTGRAIGLLTSTQAVAVLNQPINYFKSQLLLSSNSLNYANLSIPYKTSQIVSAPCQLYYPLAEHYQLIPTGTIANIILPPVTADTCGVKVWFYKPNGTGNAVGYAPSIATNYIQDLGLNPPTAGAVLSSTSFAKCFLSSAIIVSGVNAYGWVCISNA